ncbi:hypothetical protein CEXT_342671 [Caerostris extrusa]|uniref:Uncharacterized protein n=1 Tax=Caerostris extrusa TaxID=172846 RepID=A0AAV4S742_CAEEX|nr:hypothetical protein CEXT_342671 [Caerostris extrusa]
MAAGIHCQLEFLQKKQMIHRQLKFLKKKQYSNNAPINLRLMTAHINQHSVCLHSAVHSVTRLLRNVNTLDIQLAGIQTASDLRMSKQKRPCDRPTLTLSS